MLNRNRYEVIGHVGRNPELKYTSTNQPVATFSVATNRRWKNDQGQPQEHTDWHQVVVWGARAEFVSRYIKQGSYVCVVGRAESRRYEVEGVEKWSFQLNAQSVDFLDPAPGKDEPQAGDDEGSHYDGPT
jgi:single-strand DNA-binding protein